MSSSPASSFPSSAIPPSDSSSAIPSMEVVGLSAADPRLSAIDTMNNKSDMLNTLNQVGGILRRKRMAKRMAKKSRMNGGDITIPMPTPLFTDTLAGDQSTSGQTIKNAGLISTSTENSKYDSLAAPVASVPASQLKGGSRRRKKNTKKRISKKRYLRRRKTRKNRKPKK